MCGRKGRGDITVVVWCKAMYYVWKKGKRGYRCCGVR